MKRHFVSILVISLVLMGLFSYDLFAEDDVIKVGTYGPQTGVYAFMGESMVQGAELAIKEINDAGGLLGKKVVLMVYDDKSQPEQALKSVTKMTDIDKVHMIIATIHSGNIFATADIVEKAKIPSLGLGTSPTWLAMGYQYLFRVLPNSTLTSKAMMEIMKELGVEKVGIVYRADENGVTGQKDYSKLCEENGLTVVGSEAFQPGDVDITGQLYKLIKKGMDGLMFFGTGNEPIILLKQLQQLNYKGKVFGPELFSNPEIIEVCGEAAEGVIFGAPYCLPKKIEWANEGSEKIFLQKFYDYFHEMPKSDVSYRTYDAMMIYREVINKTNSIDGPTLRDAIDNLDGFEGLAGTFQFKTAKEQGKRGEGILSCRRYLIDNGRQILLTPEKIAKIKEEWKK
jgi:branched-chain amino acid transport system substrate-binding protein